MRVFPIGADREKIIRAFNSTWTEEGGFSVESALEWIFSGNDRVTTRLASARNKSDPDNSHTNPQVILAISEENFVRRSIHVIYYLFTDPGAASKLAESGKQ